MPSLSFSHIQRIVRKGELRVNGKRADSKDRLEEGQSVRIPPLKLDAPNTTAPLPAAAMMPMEVKTAASNALAWSDFMPAGFDPGMKLAVLEGDPGAGPDQLLPLPEGQRLLE